MTNVACKQLPLFDAQYEAELFHNTSRGGFFSLLVANGAEKHQTSHLLADMPCVLSLVDQTRDSWLSQAEFMRPNRRVVNLARVGLLFADLDTYKQTWAYGKTPEQQSDALIHFCESEGIPVPSIVIFSGRGLQAKWLLDTPLPRQALPRWNACQRALVDLLARMGADPAAKDASRVLRLVNTVNSKSGEICRVAHVEQGQDGEPIRYSFEYLAEALLPVARWDIEADSKAKADRRQLKLLPGGHAGNLRKFSGRQLAWDRLEDLRALATLRGGVNEGERMVHLHWRLNFLLLSGATNHRQMYYEAKALAQELDQSWWNKAHENELSTLYSKAKAFSDGERVEFNGKQYPPLYTPKNDTLINLFKITSEEQKQLKTIISSDRAKERHRDRDTARRRAAGAVDREAYLDAAAGRKATAKQLREQGMTMQAIADKMGVSIRSIKSYLASSSDGAKSLRITSGVA